LDQSSFAAPQGLSQRTTSFIASQRQGIHQMLLRHLITLMINVRSATSRTRPKKKDLSLDFSKDMFCLPSISGAHGCGPWLVRGTRCPLAEYAASLRFQTSALTPKEGRRIPLTFRIHKNGGACRDRTDDLKLAKLPLSQLS
jgi:hypothetical protein